MCFISTDLHGTCITTNQFPSFILLFLYQLLSLCHYTPSTRAHLDHHTEEHSSPYQGELHHGVSVHVHLYGVYQSLCLSVCLSDRLSVSLSLCLSFCLSVMQSTAGTCHQGSGYN